ncbi:hypothetical protein [Myceligenerans salitolerans]|uniref:DUF3817 domain-containing protein n=1 Tax=Myceligenerans salitolerans TaxID=1230528 RepID=A0ABS3I8A7_9MICO|nr:hypothetical protein [Myceligenerans salitolerans]MBO0609252.1 hypothetical protein [Myceligenerans salitolerans]
MSPRRLLHLVGSIELATLGLMLVNIATVHAPEVSSVLGPVHGLAYTTTVVVAVLVMRGRHRTWLLALVPGVGGLLAARSASPDPWEPGPDDAYV